MARATGVDHSMKRPNFIPSYESAEHQANEAAAAFLINELLAKGMASAQLIASEFAVSVKTAQIFLLRPDHHKNEVVSKGFKELAAMLTETRGTTCPVCGQPANSPLSGNRTSCRNCRTTGDAYQDGDPLLVNEDSPHEP
jgi:hypothetical protein